MEKEKYRNKITFWLRFSGWLCLLPASVCLFFYQRLGQGDLAYLLLGELFIIIIFAAYVLATADSDKWLEPSRIMVLMIFSILFIPIVILIPLCFAYFACKKLNNN